MTITPGRCFVPGQAGQQHRTPPVLLVPQEGEQARILIAHSMYPTSKIAYSSVLVRSDTEHRKIMDADMYEQYIKIQNLIYFLFSSPPSCASFCAIPLFAVGLISLAPIPTFPEDESLSVSGGNGVALAALGLLSVLTFLPTCVK